MTKILKRNYFKINLSNRFKLTQVEIDKSALTKVPANCLNVFDRFIGLALKGLIYSLPVNRKRSSMTMLLLQENLKRSCCKIKLCHRFKFDTSGN